MLVWLVQDRPLETILESRTNDGDGVGILFGVRTRNRGFRLLLCVEKFNPNHPDVAGWKDVMA